MEKRVSKNGGNRIILVDRGEIVDPPSAPVLTSAEPGPEEVTLSWEAAEGASGYVVKYRRETGEYEEVDVGRVTEYTVKGLNADITYYFLSLIHI